jgi:hypothetical protein
MHINLQEIKNYEKVNKSMKKRKESKVPLKTKQVAEL